MFYGDYLSTSRLCTISAAFTKTKFVQVSLPRCFTRPETTPTNMFATLEQNTRMYLPGAHQHSSKLPALRRQTMLELDNMFNANTPSSTCLHPHPSVLHGDSANLAQLLRIRQHAQLPGSYISSSMSGL